MRSFQADLKATKRANKFSSINNNYLVVKLISAILLKFQANKLSE